MRLGLVATLLAGMLVVAGLLAPPAHAATCANPVACENAKTGTADWMVDSPDDTIAGYTTDISSTPGGTVSFKVKTTATSYRVDIFRLGYYGGLGGRLVTSLTHTGAQT